MKTNEKHHRTLDTNGVVGIVATVLLIGLLITFVGIIQTVYVPNWLEQKEAQHLTDVENQFCELKYSLDLCVLLGQNITLSNYITLGSEELPFFNTGRTYDSLEITSDTFQINFSNATHAFSFALSDIVFSSKNTHFINQILCLEAGALVLSQPPKSILLGQPMISITNFTNISLSLLNFSGLTGKGFVSGYGTYVLSNTFTGRNTYLMNNVTDVEIYTLYPEAWQDYFNSSSFLYSGLTYTITMTDTSVHITFHDALGTFHINVYDIHSEVLIWKH